MSSYLESLTVTEKFLLISLVCVFLHIIADYLVQNEFLAKYKQKKNWVIYTKEGKYKYDYIVVLLCHSFSWSFITFLPLFIMSKYNIILCTCIVLINTVIHAVIDDIKCNKLKISLLVDQFFHLIQIELSICAVGLINSLS